MGELEYLELLRLSVRSAQGIQPARTQDGQQRPRFSLEQAEGIHWMSGLPWHSAAEDLIPLGTWQTGEEILEPADHVGFGEDDVDRKVQVQGADHFVEAIADLLRMRIDRHLILADQLR